MFRLHLPPATDIELDGMFRAMECEPLTDGKLRARAMLAILADTGCSIAALSDMKLEDVDPEQGLVLLGSRRLWLSEASIPRLVQWVAFRGQADGFLFPHFGRGKPGGKKNLDCSRPLCVADIYPIFDTFCFRGGLSRRLNIHHIRARLVLQVLEAAMGEAGIQKVLGCDADAAKVWFDGLSAWRMGKRPSHCSMKSTPPKGAIDRKMNKVREKAKRPTKETMTPKYWKE